MVLIDRVDEENSIDRTPVTVNRSLNLDNTLASESNVSSAKYLLSAVAIHNGFKSNSGHYDCVIFNDCGEGIRFDDTDQYANSLNSFMSSKNCRNNCCWCMLMKVYCWRACQEHGPLQNELLAGDVFTWKEVWCGFRETPNPVNLPESSCVNAYCLVNFTDGTDKRRSAHD